MDEQDDAFMGDVADILEAQEFREEARKEVTPRLMKAMAKPIAMKPMPKKPEQSEKRSELEGLPKSTAKRPKKSLAKAMEVVEKDPLADIPLPKQAGQMV